MSLDSFDDVLNALAKGGGNADRPTREQRAVIEAAPRPALVIAGAGSGKTHTMVQRIIKLVAVDGVEPGSILGLTFTRKAAGELRSRVTQELARLRALGVLDARQLEAPEVSTYNAYANAVYRDHALIIGREPDATLLGESSAWLLMRQVVLDSDDERLAELGSAGSITTTALSFARALRDNRLDPSRVIDFAAEFETVLELPGKKTRKVGDEKIPITFLEWMSEGLSVEAWRSENSYASVLSAVEVLQGLGVWVSLAGAYEREKRRRGFIEFSDQVAGAAEICERAPGVASELRGRAEHVILDEYQDTSAGQVAFLSSIFRDASVMAVGDPKQAIYGWRGASPGTMGRFHAEFSAERDPAQQQTFTLSTSWRNDKAVLKAANTIASGLTADSVLPNGADMPELAPRDSAGTGEIETLLFDRLDEEAAACAEAAERALADLVTVDGPPSIAMLFRKRASMTVFAAELAARGIPHHILGLGGVLSSPEVVDLSSMLRVAQDPEAGSSLIRLLAGARFQLGLKDIAALHRLARSRSGRGWRHAELGEAELRRAEALGQDGEIGMTLLDALEMVGWSDPEELRRREFSEEGVKRLKTAAELVRELRQLGHLRPLDLVDEVIRHTGLDIEIEANPRVDARQRNLDAFVNAVAGIVREHESSPMAAILDWLEVAAERDEVAAVRDEPVPGTVQLLTVHGSKGLEWDAVIVPRMVEDEFPSKPRSTRGWLAKGEVPYELRADAEALPELEWRHVDSQKELGLAFDDFSEDVKERALTEERRLAYVAVTRARHRLVLSASEWSPTVREPRAWAPYLRELADAGIIDDLPAGLPEALEAAAGPESATQKQRTERARETKQHYLDSQRPDWGAPEHPVWPRPPMGPAALAAARRAADAVRAALDASDGEPAALPSTSWDARIDLLVAEERARRQPPLVRLPGRLGASYVNEAVQHPEIMAQDLLRPVPRRPGRAARLGTKFHAWVETRYAGIARGSDASFDFDWLELDDEARAAIGIGESSNDDAAVRPWMETFLASRFADRMPVAIEQTLEMRIGSRTIVCKLDAVYEDNGVVEIVDWKTGARPRGDAEVAERQLQLQLYGLAWSRHHDVPIERIRAVLYYVPDDYELSLNEFLPEATIARMLDDAEARLEDAHRATLDEGEARPPTSRR